MKPLRILYLALLLTIYACESNCPSEYHTHYITNLKRLNDGRFEVFTDQGVYVISSSKAKRLVVPCVAELKISTDGNICSVRRVFATKSNLFYGD